MYIFEVPWIVNMVVYCDLKPTLPSRKNIMSAIMPNLAKSSLETVTDSIRPAPIVSQSLKKIFTMSDFFK